MKASDIDWGVLRNALIVLGICLAVGLTLVVWSVNFADGAHQDLTRADRQLRRVKTEFQSLDELEKLIVEYNPRFEELHDEGIVGGEKRLAWIQSLRDASEALKLPSLNYSIRSQTLYEPGFPVEAGSFKTYASTMALKLGLLHGEDLVRFLNELDEKVAGLYTVSQCTMARGEGKSNVIGVRANLQATCDLDWITIRTTGAGA